MLWYICIIIVLVVNLSNGLWLSLVRVLTITLPAVSYLKQLNVDVLRTLFVQLS